MGTPTLGRPSKGGEWGRGFPGGGGARRQKNGAFLSGGDTQVLRERGIWGTMTAGGLDRTSRSKRGGGKRRVSLKRERERYPSRVT